MIIESIIGVTKSQYVSLKLKYWVFKVKEEEMNNEKKNKYRQIFLDQKCDGYTDGDSFVCKLYTEYGYFRICADREV